MEILGVEELSPQENMNRDLGLFISLEEGSGKPTFRLYKWDCVCLSLGHFQKDKEDLRLPVVRRPTGGGALLHGWDISFCLVDFKENWGYKPSNIYRNVSELFIRAFSKLGVCTRLERFKGRYLDRFFCFWVPTLGELTHNRKKLLSMAMRTGRSAFLIHGSLYVDFDYAKACELLGVPEGLLRDRIISLSELGVGEMELIESLVGEVSLYLAR